MKTSVIENEHLASLQVTSENDVKVKGVLNFDTVPVLMKQAEKIFADFNKVCVDFNEVSSSNSAGLALILEMMRYMKNKNKMISFNNLPDPVNVVVRAYGIDDELKPYIKP